MAAIKALGAQAGVALNPSTPVSVLEYVAADLDVVLVMSVNPGFGGQTFIARSLDKVRAVRDLLARAGSPAISEIDGGVDLTNIAAVADAGVAVVVAGQAVCGHGDAAAAARALKAAAGAGAGRRG